MILNDSPSDCLGIHTNLSTNEVTGIAILPNPV